MNRYLNIIPATLVTLVACGESVPPGHVGIKIDVASGMDDSIVLDPGIYSCFGRDKLALIETKEETRTEEMQILCADNMKLGFDLKVRTRLAEANSESIKDLLSRQGANMDWGKEQWGCPSRTLKYDFMYENYVSPQARAIAREVVGKYDTTQINENRERINGEIQKRLTDALNGTPMELVNAMASEFKYPQVIVTAVEKAKAREIQIQEEKAKREIELQKADNRMKVAEKMKAVRTAEAEADATYNAIVGQSLSAEYIQLRRIEAEIAMYESIGDNDKIIMTGSSGVMPTIPIDTKRRSVSKKVE